VSDARVIRPLARTALLATLLLGGLPAGSAAQVFLASRPNSGLTVGPLFVRASVTPEEGPLTVDVLWSLVVPPNRSAVGLEQDVFLLWPSTVVPDPQQGSPDQTLTRYVEERGFTVIEDGRLELFAQSLYQMGAERPPDPVAGGAPFVTFVRQGGALGITPPATLVRVPWTPKLVNRVWLMNLRMRTKGLVKPKPRTWVDEVFWGARQRLVLSFNDVNQRAIFPMYFEHRDRVLRLADEPAQLLANFAKADHLKIDELSPQSARRQLSETLDNTDVVSLFLDRSEGISPQVLSVQYGYFSDLQSWAPVLIPIVFFALGNLAGPLARALLSRVGRAVAARVHVGRPDAARPGRTSGSVLDPAALARLKPGETTYADVLALCGPGAEEQEQLGASDRRLLVYRGQRVVPQRRWTFGWIATVDHWDQENHEVQITVEGNTVRDVQARVSRTRLTHPEP